MSEDDDQSRPPPGIHEPYELVESVPIQVFNSKADGLGFKPRSYCEGRSVSWRREPSYSHCPHFSTVYTNTKLKYQPSPTSPKWQTFETSLKDRQIFSDFIDSKNYTFVKILPEPENDFILAFFNENNGNFHKGVIFDTKKDEIFAVFEANSVAQFSSKNVKQMMISRCSNIVSLVVAGNTFEIWSYELDPNNPPHMILLHIHNSIQGALQFHGPLFTSIPGKGIDLYCAAFFKDQYRLKDLYGSYFIALIDSKQNRYFKVKGPDGLGLRAWDWGMKQCHMQAIEASPCGSYIAVTLENSAGRSLLVVLLETTNLTAIKVFPQVRLGITANNWNIPHNASCFMNCRITFSRCSTLFSVFSHTSNMSPLDRFGPNVNVYQLPVKETLMNICKIFLRRGYTHEQLCRLPLPQALIRFVGLMEVPPTESDYIETSMGLRQFEY